MRAVHDGTVVQINCRIRMVEIVYFCGQIDECLVCCVYTKNRTSAGYHHRRSAETHILHPCSSCAVVYRTVDFDNYRTKFLSKRTSRAAQDHAVQTVQKRNGPQRAVWMRDRSRGVAFPCWGDWNFTTRTRLQIEQD